MDDRYNFIPVWLSIGTKRTRKDNPLEPSPAFAGTWKSTKRTRKDNPLEHDMAINRRNGVRNVLEKTTLWNVALYGSLTTLVRNVLEKTTLWN